MSFKTIEEARKARDVRNETLVNPPLRDTVVIVFNANEEYAVVTLGFATANGLEIVK